jgi:low temperature requirement protein LtrA
LIGSVSPITTADRNGPRVARLLRVRPTGEDHSATDFELLFDLVYVFALTQVTGYVGHEHTVHGAVQGVLMLALLWWTWCAYSWLGNQARADEGLVRAGMAVAMAAIFVVALTIPEAWRDADGGLDGPVVFVFGYLVVRSVHLVVYAVAARGDDELRHQIAISWFWLTLGGALLLAGALVGGWQQTVLFAGALAVDWGGTYVTSRNGSWRVHSATHWTERYGLFVILAIGESIVAIGVGAAHHAISAPLLLAAGLGVASAICLWWLYFDVVSVAAEQRFHETTGAERVRMAVEAYTYGHFPIVAGIIIAAIGVEGVLAHADDSKGLGAYYAVPLYGGLALYLAGQLFFKRRVLGSTSRERPFALAALLLALPAAIVLPPLAALAGVVVILGALIAVESTRYADQRRGVRAA